MRGLPDPTALPGPDPGPGRLRELDLVVSAVQRQRPAVPVAEVDLLVGAVAAALAARHPLDGYFPVLVHGTVLALLPPCPPDPDPIS